MVQCRVQMESEPRLNMVMVGKEMPTFGLWAGGTTGLEGRCIQVPVLAREKEQPELYRVNFNHLRNPGVQATV